MPSRRWTRGQTGNSGPAPDSPLNGLCVIMTVTCHEGHILGQWIDSISEKYPFYCDACGYDTGQGKYPWSITTQIAERTTARAVVTAGMALLHITPNEESTRDLPA